MKINQSDNSETTFSHQSNNLLPSNQHNQFTATLSQTLLRHPKKLDEAQRQIDLIDVRRIPPPPTPSYAQEENAQALKILAARRRGIDPDDSDSEEGPCLPKILPTGNKAIQNPLFKKNLENQIQNHLKRRQEEEEQEADRQKAARLKLRDTIQQLRRFNDHRELAETLSRGLEPHTGGQGPKEREGPSMMETTTPDPVKEKPTETTTPDPAKEKPAETTTPDPAAEEPALPPHYGNTTSFRNFVDQHSITLSAITVATVAIPIIAYYCTPAQETPESVHPLLSYIPETILQVGKTLAAYLPEDFLPTPTPEPASSWDPRKWLY